MLLSNWGVKTASFLLARPRCKAEAPLFAKGYTTSISAAYSLHFEDLLSLTSLIKHSEEPRTSWARLGLLIYELTFGASSSSSSSFIVFVMGEEVKEATLAKHSEEAASFSEPLVGDFGAKSQDLLAFII